MRTIHNHGEDYAACLMQRPMEETKASRLAGSPSHRSLLP
ncbi:hypothetical protein Z949_1719 [Sulfitobacter guttiformis KCTC 32187]|nr:hypothetical protein Z949_1719 [Sulfitobacter guttiformis KCTC 32187]